jgi:hypothetical protein
MYLLIFFLTLPHCILIFAVELNESNIRHLENGREANAGVALFPLIPFSQIFSLGVAWVINQNKWLPEAGSFVTIAALIHSMPFLVYSYVKTRKQLRVSELVRESNEQ